MIAANVALPFSSIGVAIDAENDERCKRMMWMRRRQLLRTHILLALVKIPVARVT
jgi:hypothetical protein